MRKIPILLLTALLFNASAVYAAPEAPINVSAVPQTATSIKLSWTAAGTVAFYEIFRNSTSTPVATTTATEYTDSNLAPSTLYNYFVAAVDASSTRSDISAFAAISTLADATAPSIPAILTATGLSLTAIRLNWASSTDDVAVIGYNVYRDGALRATTTSLSFDDTGLASTTAYAYQVSAVDNAGNESAKSQTATITPSVDQTAPGIPSSLSGNSPTSTEILLNWQAPADNIGIAEYRIYRNDALRGTTTANSYRDTGLTASTSYSYAVSAVDLAGNESGRTALVSIVTLPIAGLPVVVPNVNLGYYNKQAKPKLINLNSWETIKVVVYSDSQFNPRNIDLRSVRLAGAKPTGWFLKDVNKDRKLDRVLTFRARDMKDLYNTDTKAYFTAKTRDGKILNGELPVTVKNSKRKKPVVMPATKPAVKIEKKVEKLKEAFNKQFEKMEKQIGKIEDKIEKKKEQMDKKIEQLKN